MRNIRQVAAEMGKWKSSYDSGRKYREEWEKQFVWVKSQRGKDGSAYCKLCSCLIQPKRNALVLHEKSEKHRKHAPASTSSARKFFHAESSDDVKVAELQLAAAICCHAAVSSVDHLCELAKKNGKGSTIGKINLHRTKCSKLITEVLSPAFEAELREDVRDQKFSLIVDESTDISSGKHLAIVIRFYSKRQKKIVTEFVGLVPVIEATSDVLFAAIKSTVEALGLRLADCVGFGSDGASVMVGKNNSVWTRLRREAPECVLVRCICHSLALCVQSAFEVLPSSLGFLITEIPKWFS